MGRVALLNTAIGFAVILLLRGETLASHHYTDKQMDALAHRIGKIFWLNAANGKIPTFVDGPSAKAGKVQPGVNESFIITDVAGRARKDPFYSVKFESGKIAYISPEMFHEALNLTIVSSDPRADEKTQAGQREREEKERVEWIQAQPWPQVVKQAAIRKQATPGLKRVRLSACWAIRNGSLDCAGRLRSLSSIGFIRMGRC